MSRDTLILLGVLVALWWLSRARAPLVTARIGGADVAPGVDVGILDPDEGWIE